MNVVCGDWYPRGSCWGGGCDSQCDAAGMAAAEVVVGAFLHSFWGLAGVAMEVLLAGGMIRL